MNFKSLLALGAAIGISASASAAPEVGIYPTPGSTFDSRQMFATFNLSVTGSYTVAEGASATLECLDTGDIFNSTQFSDFMGMAIMVKFDDDAITDNGEYELVVPEGSFTVDGEPNAKITATYVLNDANLGIGEYPQITLVSTNPADGAGVAAIGAEALNRVAFVTSDDAAVNYIGWEIRDETTGEYVYSGNENRIDLNRNETLDDVWANGLYISIGGPDQKLYKGHTYKMSLRFCGIGYDPVTNQYPTPNQIEKSTELVTSISFVGLTEGSEYSPYVYESVSPDPETYEIETAEEAIFSITYSGPVKPTIFTYHRGQSDTPVAGTYAPVNDEDGDGYASIWEFTVAPEIASVLVGMAKFDVTTVDANGLVLKGNADYEMENFVYSVTYECTVGLPDLVSVAPAADSQVESLSEIIVSNSEGLVMAYGYNASEKARIVSLTGEEIRVLEEPVTVEGDESQMKWEFDPITENGSYILMIPKYYFAIGEEFDGTTSKLTAFRYFVDNGQVSEGAVFDLVPVSVSPEDGATVEEIKEVVLTFDDVTLYPMSEGAPTATLVNLDSDAAVIYTSEPAVDNDWFNPTAYTFTFATPLTENGTYKFTVKKGAFCDETYDMEMGETGHANDELVYTFIVKNGSGVEAVAAANVKADVFSADGKVVLRNAAEADVKALPAGLYIYNGKKVIIK